MNTAALYISGRRQAYVASRLRGAFVDFEVYAPPVVPCEDGKERTFRWVLSDGSEIVWKARIVSAKLKWPDKRELARAVLRVVLP